MTTTVTYSGNEIAHLIGALVTAPMPEGHGERSHDDREVRRVLIERAYAVIASTLPSDVRAAIEARLAELEG